MGVRGGGAPPLPPFIITTKRRSARAAHGGVRGGGAPPLPSTIITTLFLQQYFSNNILQLFSHNLNKALNSLTNIIIINININSEFVQTLLLSNQIRCWEGGMGGGYPLPNHLIWLDNKLINIYSLISTHKKNNKLRSEPRPRKVRPRAELWIRFDLFFHAFALVFFVFQV